MSRHRKIEEDAWDEDDERLSADHVVERFFSRHERDAEEEPRRPRIGQRARRRPNRPDLDGESNSGD
jgi:hypothetical protein